MSVAGEQSCWVCNARPLQLAKAADLEGELESRSFAITDSHYGQTAAIFRCPECGFLQCSELAEVLPYYQDLEDPEYEEGRSQRCLQMERLLRCLPKARAGSTLLDVGAGSGMLVEEALKKGYRAFGIEPSRWLQERALECGLPVELGTLPHPDLTGPYDVVTLVDVLEHVSDPMDLLARARAVLAPEGTLVVVTPDVSSLAARLLGWRWWHFRVAHIGYFNRQTLQQALGRAGFTTSELRRPTWYFSADYLADRVNCYLPGRLEIPYPSFFRSLTVPLNLGDSLLVLASPGDLGE